jgi:hypothetical protein
MRAGGVRLALSVLYLPVLEMGERATREGKERADIHQMLDALCFDQRGGQTTE